MTCQVPRCSGTSSDSFCSEHDHICILCGIPTTPNYPTCSRCKAKNDGVKCADCGSPWLYITRHPEDEWICKPCTYSTIILMKYEPNPDEVVAYLKALDDLWTEKAKEEAAKQEVLAERMNKVTAKRTKHKQSEALFGEA